MQQKHRDKLKQKIGEMEYKKRQVEYMREYRAKQKQKKQDSLKIARLNNYFLFILPKQ